MKTSIYTIIIVLSIILLSGCGSSDSNTPKKVTFNSVLHNDSNWSHGFADYSDLECEIDNCDQTAEYRDLPQGFNDARGYFMESNNHSDDMLMALWRKIDGLVPNTTYQVDINTTLATPHCSGMFGIGGSPDSSNYVRAGMIGFMPAISQVDGRYTINLDKGNQAQEGENAIIIGDLGC